ncbi:hypothetical protein ACER0A_009420 [Haloimpatiens sp. FM7315]|uniref:hypothetical protein n=1 Tax=Haloimpatiens sp. FM7315 TaxID=3298609 RepID=UPI0035A279B0
MSYNVLDIIDRSIDICNKILNNYRKINDKQVTNNSLKIVTKVFISRETERIKFYEDLKNRIEKENISDIDFFIYDKISSLMAEFNSNLIAKEHKNVKDFMTCVISMNKDCRALFIDIRGRMIQKKEDGESFEYKILTDIIRMEEKYILELEMLSSE